MLTGPPAVPVANDITKMRELLAAPILPPSAIDAMVPRELDRIVMKSLEIDPKDRYQTSADMAADLERTLIAARYSSRDLPKLLRDLYMAEGKSRWWSSTRQRTRRTSTSTIAITSTTTLPPAEHTKAVRHKEETQIRMRRRARRALAPERMRWRSGEGRSSPSRRRSLSARSPSRASGTSPSCCAGRRRHLRPRR